MRGLLTLLLLLAPVAATAKKSLLPSTVGGTQLLQQHLRSSKSTEGSASADRPNEQQQDASQSDSHSFTWPSFLIKAVERIPDLLDQVAINVGYHNTWEEIVTFPERKPYSFNVGLATFKTFAADLLVQLCSAPCHPGAGAIDWRRSSAFAIFGFLYVGIAQWFFYVSLFSVLCPHAIRFANEPVAAKLRDSVGLHELVQQVFYDNLILQAFIYFPVFYTIKEAINTFLVPDPTEQSTTTSDALASPRGKNPLSFGTLKSVLTAGIMTYSNNFFVDNSLSCAMWIPCDFLIYSVPMFLRLPLDHLLAFCWTMGLSYMRGRSTIITK